MAHRIAGRFRNRGESLEDLRQVAALGLVKAIDRYEPERGAFESYAVPTITGEIKRHFRDRMWALRVPRRVQELRNKVRVARRELVCGLALGAVLGAIGVVRILVWQGVAKTYGEHGFLLAITVGMSLVGVVTFGTLAGSMLPFVLRRLGFDPASASAPFVATLVDVTGLIIYFTVAIAILGRTLLAAQ